MKLSDEYKKLLRQTAHGSFVLLIGQVSSTMILALAQIVIASLLGDERLGDYTMVFVPVEIAILLQDIGINVGLTAHIARYHHQGLEEEKKTILMSGLMFNILLSSIVTFMVFMSSPWIASSFLHRPDLTALVQVASIVVFGQALVKTTNAVFIGYGKMKFQSLNSVIFSLARITISPLLVFIGFGTIGAVAGYSISTILTGFLALFLVVLLLRNTRGIIEIFSITREFGLLIRYGLPVYLSSLIGGGLSQIYGSLMVLYVVNVQIGNWSAANYFSAVVGFVTVPLSMAIFPLFSKLRRGNEDLGKAYQSAVKYSSLFALPIAGALIALSDPIITLLFDGKFPLAAFYLQLNMLGQIYLGLGSIATGNLLNGQGETRITLRCAIINLFIGVPLALYMIPNFGIIGMILTMIIVPLPGTMYGLYWIKINFGIGPNWRSNLKIYLSVIPSTLLSLLFVDTLSNLWVELVGGITIFAFSYFVMVKVFRVLDHIDYEMFRAIVGDTGPLAPLVNRFIDLFE